MRSNLWDDPRVSRIVDATDSSEAAVVGALYWLWATADQHTEDGVLIGMSLRALDRKTGVQGFGAALVSVGWLEDGAEGVRVVRFEEHNGRSAKRRCSESVRKMSARDADKAQTQSEHCEDEQGTKCAPREEKRREEVNAVSVDTATEKKSGRQSVGIRELVGAGVCRQHAADWLKVREKPLTVTAWNRVVAEAGKAGITPAEAVRIAAENSWRGFKADWMSRVGDGAESTYTPAQVAVFEAYNSVLGAKEWPAASMEPFSPERAAAISQFLTFNDKPDFVRRYFDYLAENLSARPGFGLDWTLRRDIYLRAREGNFSSGSHE